MGDESGADRSGAGDGPGGDGAARAGKERLKRLASLLMLPLRAWATERIVRREGEGPGVEPGGPGGPPAGGG